MTAALEISGLCKTFGDNVAVDDIDLGRPRAPSSGLSARTAPARPPRCPWRSACCDPTAAPPGSSATTSGPTRTGQGAGRRPARRAGHARAADRAGGADLHRPAARAAPPRSRRAGRGTARRAGARRRRADAGRSTTPPACARRSAWPPPCCTRRGCWCSTSRSRRSTRSPPPRIKTILRRFVAGGGSVVLLQPRHGAGRAALRPRRRHRRRARSPRPARSTRSAVPAPSKTLSSASSAPQTADRRSCRGCRADHGPDEGGRAPPFA